MDESVSYLQLQSIANSATTFSGLLVCSLVVILFFSRFFSVSIWTSMPCSISFIAVAKGVLLNTNSFTSVCALPCFLAISLPFLCTTDSPLVSVTACELVLTRTRPVATATLSVSCNVASTLNDVPKTSTFKAPASTVKGLSVCSTLKKACPSSAAIRLPSCSSKLKEACGESVTSVPSGKVTRLAIVDVFAKVVLSVSTK